MKFRFYFVALNLFLICGCGIKGDPRPPSELENVQKAEPIGSNVNPATNSSQTENDQKKPKK